MACGCIQAEDLIAGVECVEANPGIESTIVIVDDCEVLDVPEPDAGTSTISADVTVTPGYVGKIFRRYDRKTNGSITGEKKTGNIAKWQWEVFIPGNDDTTHNFVKALTNDAYSATCFATDNMGNTYLLEDCYFEMTFDTKKINDSGQAGYVLTCVSNSYPNLYTGLIP